MKKFLQDDYRLLNPEKYVSSNPPKYKSSWELTIMRMCDTRDDILQWGYEPIKIPYRNPFTKRQTVYVPDFLVLFVDKHGKKRLELWEIKPARQSNLNEARTDRDKMSVALNAVKWQAAQLWAEKNNAVFRVITEDSIYRNPRK